MKKKAILISSIFLIFSNINAQENKVPVKPEKPKLINPAEHNPSSNLHYGQANYGKSAFTENNKSVGGRGVGSLPSGREAEEKAAQAKEEMDSSEVKTEKAVNSLAYIPVYERKSLFNSYLKGVVEDAALVHISPKLLTSSLDLYSGDVFVDVAKKGDNNIRAFALIIRLSDGSRTSLFQSDRGENFKPGNMVQAPIILLKQDFTLGVFTKLQ